MAPLIVPVVPLTRDAFAAFGEVIETEGSNHYTINSGFAERYHDLAHVDVLENSGKPLISIFHALPRSQPIHIEGMERHPLSSQAFMPLSPISFLVVVAAPTEELQPEHLRAFITNGRQGVNYRRGIWHHALLALQAPSDFLVIDRGGREENCDEIAFGGRDIVLAKC